MILRHRVAAVSRTLLLAVAGLLVASPFLTFRGVGTGESYNYSLAVADGVTQMRAGVFPVLVGQSTFAFNGRVHPLRNAPYLIYLAGAIDLLTGHRLGFPGLQNLSLAFSLVASFFAAYLALRWGARCPPWPAAFLAVLYGSSTAILAAAYSFDLYMTVHAAPFVPLALGAVARQATAPAIRNDFALAAAVAAAWWAHPPVALWLTTAIGPLRLLLWAGQPSWRGLAGLAGAFAFGLALAGFTFVSTYEITHYATFFNAGARETSGYVALVLGEVRRAFVRSVSPVSRSAGSLGDFQLGYAGWLLLGSVVAVIRQPGPWRGRRLAAAGFAAVAILLAGLCVPVPYFTRWAWTSLPGVFYDLTNDWPMQRLYLIMVAAVLLASGLVLGPRTGTAWAQRPFAFIGLLVLAAGWSAWEAYPFVARGFRDRWSADVTARNYLPSNLDLTTTSYAFIGSPPTFCYGAMEPWTEFRLLGHDGREGVDSNYDAALATGTVAAEGEFRQAAGGPGNTRYDPGLTLEPGQHYLLRFAWRNPPFPGILSLSGPSLQRLYMLPHAGESQSFGMGPGQRAAIAVSTSRTSAEPVQLRVLNLTGNTRDVPPPRLADFKLLVVDPGRLPVRIKSWVPLRAEVTAPADGCYVETPRRFIPGYAAIVDGRRMRAVASPTGEVMVPVPAGVSAIELSYPGTPLLRAAFWTSLTAWLAGAVAAGLLGFAPGRPIFEAGRAGRTAGTARSAGRRRSPTGWVVAGLVVITGTVLGWIRLRHPDGAPGSVGPIGLHLLLPKGRTSRQEPILVAGRRGAGDIIFLSYTDDSHVRVGVDIWGYMRLSDPVPVDYNQEQEVVVSGGMLYPPGDPFMRSLNPSARERLRRELRVDLNGRTVMVDTRPTFESSPAEITIGTTAIGGSTVEPRFHGRILQVERLPVPLAVVLSPRSLRLQLMLPANHAGLTEPLLTVGMNGPNQEVFALTYLAGSRVSLSCVATDGLRVQGAPQPARLDSLHTLELSNRGPDLTLSLDGAPGLTLTHGAIPPGQVRLARLGVNAADAPGVRARFTGPVLRLADPGFRPPSLAAPAREPVRVVAILPSGRTGVFEPLLVTGKTSKGDIVYVKYTDSAHIQFGYDHWGVGGSMSEPIAIDYAVPHEFEIGLGSLYAERKDAAWLGLPADVRERLRQQATVRLDGVAAWECRSPSYPTDPADIRVGENRIGASSCSPRFTGEVLEVGRGDPRP